MRLSHCRVRWPKRPIPATRENRSPLFQCISYTRNHAPFGLIHPTAIHLVHDLHGRQSHPRRPHPVLCIPVTIPRLRGATRSCHDRFSIHLRYMWKHYSACSANAIVSSRPRLCSSMGLPRALNRRRGNQPECKLVSIVPTIQNEGGTGLRIYDPSSGKHCPQSHGHRVLTGRFI